MCVLFVIFNLICLRIVFELVCDTRSGQSPQKHAVVVWQGIATQVERQCRFRHVEGQTHEKHLFPFQSDTANI